MNDSSSSQTFDQASALYKLWADSFSKLTQGAFSLGPDAMPPEMLKEVRAGVFRALGQYWETYLRSPEFLETMKQLMDSSIQIRKFTNESLTKTWHDLGGTAHDDVDKLLAAVQHLEERTLSRMDQLVQELAQVRQELVDIKANGSTVPSPSARRAPRRSAPDRPAPRPAQRSKPSKKR